MRFTESEIEKRTVKKGDLLVCEGGDIGRSAIWKYENEIRIQNHLHRLRPYDRIQTDFYYYILYLYKMNGKINGNGIGLQGLSSNALHTIIVPVPPVEEQRKIVSAIKKTIMLVSEIDIKRENMSACIRTIKSKILDLAIRGKLVPQDPNDEPASVLLDRIRAEKEELIRAGKIKRDKKESVISKGDDNSYYEIPPSWALTTLGELASIITKGTTPRGGNSFYSTSGVGFLRAENIIGFDKISLNNLKYVDEETHQSFLKRSVLQSNDILITIAGTLGRTGIVSSNMLPLNTNQAVSIIRLLPNIDINPIYLIYSINSPIIKRNLLHQEVAMAIPNLSLENITNCRIPLPPFNEQNRIVETIDKYFNILDSIVNINI